MTRRLTPLLALALLAWTPLQEAGSSTAQEKWQQSHFFKDAMLVGVLEPEDLRQEPFAEWFDSGYGDYEVGPAALAQLSEAAADDSLSVEIFLGTWCQDSQREVPRVLRVLDEARFPGSRVTLYGLSDHPGVFKTTPGGHEQELLVHRTATIVVLRNGVELGRLVEKPSATLEEDLLAILNESPAPVPYGAESAIHALYRANDAALVRAPTSAFLDQLEALGDTDSLWHYAQYDLLFNGHAADAADVLHLFLTLHPESALGYRLLAQAESELGNTGAALFAVRRALAIDPDNGAAKRLEQRILTSANRRPPGTGLPSP
jgi:tetratricopeptide (TPR) repeat protein